MFSSDHNIETLSQLIEALKEYFSLHKDYMQVKIIEKIVKLLTVLLLFMILAFIFTFVIVLLSFAAVAWLYESANLSIPLSFCVVALAHLFIFITVYCKRVTWIQRPLVKLFADILTN